MGCTFCRTAEMKLVRNLTQGEILAQILETQRRSEERISNIVLMGMGEPLHNYQNVMGALQIMTDEQAMQLGSRRITLSSVGLAPEIEQFAKDSRVKLALSLNATTDESRERLMPVTKRYPLERLIQACKVYTRHSRHRVTLEYVMMAGVNDTKDDLKRLSHIASQFPSKINLIPYNDYPGSPYQRPGEEKILHFHNYLADRHHQVNIRYSKGLDILAACGQLATQGGREG